MHLLSLWRNERGGRLRPSRTLGACDNAGALRYAQKGRFGILRPDEIWTKRRKKGLEKFKPPDEIWTKRRKKGLEKFKPCDHTPAESQRLHFCHFPELELVRMCGNSVRRFPREREITQVS